MTEPRAYTPDEARDLLLDQVAATVRYWANLPEMDKATGRTLTTMDRCDGVAFSILNILDGCAMDFPAMTLRLEPHEDDKKFAQDNDENWFEPGTEIATMLHEHYSQQRR